MITVFINYINSQSEPGSNGYEWGNFRLSLNSRALLPNGVYCNTLDTFFGWNLILLLGMHPVRVNNNADGIETNL